VHLPATTEPLRVFLAIEETTHFHPEFVEDVLRNTSDDIVGAALVVWTPPQANLNRYLLRHWYQLRPSEALRLAWRTYTSKRDVIAPNVRSVLQNYEIPFFEVTEDINYSHYVDRIRAFDPDVILSSQAHVFDADLIAAPRLCCLNRHASLLPAYGGLWAPFHAYRCGETETGVTIHTTTNEIDQGVSIAQRRVPCHDDDTLLGLYAKCFQESADAVLDALDKVRNGDFSPCATSGPASYYSYPTRDEWRSFRSRGGRLI
jgi:methionyl-tRNA formyltransferase